MDVNPAPSHMEQYIHYISPATTWMVGDVSFYNNYEANSSTKIITKITSISSFIITGTNKFLNLIRVSEITKLITMNFQFNILKNIKN